MKYVVDIDALKGCLDLLDSFRVNGNEAVFVHNVKLLIDRFPKDKIEPDGDWLVTGDAMEKEGV